MDCARDTVLEAQRLEMLYAVSMEGCTDFFLFSEFSTIISVRILVALRTSVTGIEVQATRDYLTSFYCTMLRQKRLHLESVDFEWQQNPTFNFHF